MIAAQLFIVCCLAAITVSLPLEDARPVIDEKNTAIWEPAEDIIEEIDGIHTRTKRATCDLLSFKSKWLTINDSACAAHCLAMFKGYKGGYCKNSICHCRK